MTQRPFIEVILSFACPVVIACADLLSPPTLSDPPDASIEPSKDLTMATLKKNVMYRFQVRFEPPLSTLAQFRQLAQLMSNQQGALVGVTPARAVIDHSFLIDVGNVVKGGVWFTVGGADANGKTAPKGPVSKAVIEKISIEQVYR